MSDELNNYFVRIDSAISANAPTAVINGLLNDSLRYIVEDLETGDETIYNSARYQYHKKRSCYFKISGQEEESKKEEDRAKRYQSKLDSEKITAVVSKNLSESNAPPAVATTDSLNCNISQTNDRLAASKRSVQNCFDELKTMLVNDSTTVTEIEELLKVYSVEQVYSFAECHDLYTKSNEICAILSILQTQKTTDEKKEEKEENLGKVCDDFRFSALCKTFSPAVKLCEYEFRRTFCQFLLSNNDKILELIFSDIPLTEERIGQRYRKFGQLFHPDIIDEGDSDIFHNVFVSVFNKKEKLMSEIKDSGNILERVNSYKENGQTLWETARDYSRARRSNQPILVHLKEDELRNCSDETLSENQKLTALLSYEQYRAAAHLLTTNYSVEDRSELRRLMARSLYTAEMHVQAQIYTIAAMYILVRATGNASKKKLDELQKFLETIRDKQEPVLVKTVTRSPITSTIRVTSESSISQSLSALALRDTRQIVPVNLDQSSALVLMSNIKHELRKLVLEQCLIKSVEKSVNTSQELIISAKRKAALYRTRGIVIGGASVGTGYVIIHSALEAAAGGAAIGSFLGPAGTCIGFLMGGGIVIGGGLLLSKRLFDKSKSEFQEPTKRENLNKQFESALAIYKKLKYGDFLKELAKDYWPGYHLITIEEDERDKKIRVLISPREIIKVLLEHEFRPDGIAYLLNLIGEALLNNPKLSGEKEIKQPAASTFNEIAVSCFEEIFSESENSDLLNRAKKLDKQVQKKSLLSEEQLSYFEKLYRTLTSPWSAYVYSIPKEYFQDALTTPFTSRLKELGHIAQLNYAIAQIIIGERDNLEECQNILHNIKQRLAATSHNQFFPMSKTTMDALDDLLLAFGLMPKPVEDTEILALEYRIEIENVKIVMIGNVPVSCESVISAKYARDHLQALCDLSVENVCTNQPDFVQKVKNMYESEHVDQSFADKVTRMLQVDKSLNISTWFNEVYCARQWCLTAAHLPVLAKVYKVEFYSCRVSVNSTYGHIFVPSATIDGKIASMNSRIFVVLNEASKIIGMFKISSQLITDLYKQLLSAETDQMKIDIQYQIAKHYQLDAENSEKFHHLKALTKWNEAQKYYSNVLEIDPQNLLASIGKGRCLIMLSKWTSAENFLRKTLLNHEQSAEAWFLLGLARRKLRMFDLAENAFNTAQSFEPNLVENVQKEKQLLLTLSCKGREERIKLFERMTVTDRKMTTRFNHIREKSSSSYNILSIDGGGIRGLIPAVWLTEIERLTNRSAVSLFNMMAGTSTGAILAAGLCTPNRDHPTQPRYRAAELVQLYRTRADDVFTKSHKGLFSFLPKSWTLTSKYRTDSRHKLFKYYFDHTKLSQVLTELVIPAVKNDSQSTHQFHRQECRENLAPDYELHDILMCTTAAPTYFDRYKLGDCQYVDGGVQMNNPVMAAHDQAIAYDKANGEKMFILSLGTGDYVPDPLHPDEHRNLLFYARHNEEILKIIFDAPQYNVDLHMLNLLGKERYQRWQLWFEKPLSLDAIDENSIDFLFDKAREYFEERLALDNSDRLGLVLDRLKGDPH